MGSGGNEHFCLRWNDFESNISRAFQDIREEEDFFDVTIACEDEQVQAHKVILSACSPFFKKILKKHPHQHPLLFLKGVKYSDILSILNFMYHGEVNVTQDDLNGFLAVAEELKVKGLTQGGGQGEQSKSPVQGTRRPRDPPDPDSGSNVRQTAVKKSRTAAGEATSVTPVTLPVKTEPVAMVELASEAASTAAVVAEGEPYEHVFADYTGGYGDDEGAAQYDANNAQAIRGNKETAQFVMSQVDEGQDEIGHRIFNCRLCDFSSERKEKVRQHVESWHGDEMGIRYRCDYCDKQYKCHSNLRSHLSRDHKNQSWPY